MERDEIIVLGPIFAGIVLMGMGSVIYFVKFALTFEWMQFVLILVDALLTRPAWTLTVLGVALFSFGGLWALISVTWFGETGRGDW